MQRSDSAPRLHHLLIQRMYGRWWWLLLSGFVLAVLFWLRVDTPVPMSARAQALLHEADDALARGHLSASDGSGARELYEAVQAIDPDLPAARRGRVEVGRAVLARARAALTMGEMTAAQRDLDLARQLQVPRAEWAAVDIALREQALAQVSVSELLARAEAAREQGWLTDVPPEFPDTSAALPLYREILILQPGLASALRGREDALAQLLDEARAALRAGDLETAAPIIANVSVYDPGHIDLPDTLARLTEERAGVYKQATAALAQGQIDAAITGWQRLLALNPDDTDARDGLEHAAKALAERAATLGESLQLAEAGRVLQRARALSSSSPAVHAAEVRIARARQGQPEMSAASLQALGACFEAELAANNLGSARECLNASRAQGEDVATLGARRRQLAQRWVAIGEERLGSGNLSAATKALASARDIDPSTPEVQGLARRLETVDR